MRKLAVPSIKEPFQLGHTWVVTFWPTTRAFHLKFLRKFKKYSSLQTYNEKVGCYLHKRTLQTWAQLGGHILAYNAGFSPEILKKIQEIFFITDLQ